MNTIEHPSSNGVATHVEVIRARPPRKRLLRALERRCRRRVGRHRPRDYQSRAGGAPTYVTAPVSRATSCRPSPPPAPLTRRTRLPSARKSPVRSRDRRRLQFARPQGRSPRESRSHDVPGASIRRGQHSRKPKRRRRRREPARAARKPTSDGAARNAVAAAAQARRRRKRPRASNEAAIATAHANVVKAQSALALAQQTVSRDQSLLVSRLHRAEPADADRSHLVAAQTALAARASRARNKRAAQAARAGEPRRRAAAQAARSAPQPLAAAQAAPQRVAPPARATPRSRARRRNCSKPNRTCRRPSSRRPSTEPSSRATFRSAKRSRRASKRRPSSRSRKTSRRWKSISPSVNRISATCARATASTSRCWPIRTEPSTAPCRKFASIPSRPQNVVTYTTVVLVENRDGALLPGHDGERFDRRRDSDERARSYRSPR